MLSIFIVCLPFDFIGQEYFQFLCRDGGREDLCCSGDYSVRWRTHLFVSLLQLRLRHFQETRCRRSLLLRGGGSEAFWAEVSVSVRASMKQSLLTLLRTVATVRDGYERDTVLLHTLYRECTVPLRR